MSKHTRTHAPTQSTTHACIYIDMHSHMHTSRRSARVRSVRMIEVPFSVNCIITSEFDSVSSKLCMPTSQCACRDLSSMAVEPTFAQPTSSSLSDRDEARSLIDASLRDARLHPAGGRRAGVPRCCLRTRWRVCMFAWMDKRMYACMHACMFVCTRLDVSAYVCMSAELSTPNAVLNTKFRSREGGCDVLLMPHACANR